MDIIRWFLKEPEAPAGSSTTTTVTSPITSPITQPPAAAVRPTALYDPRQQPWFIQCFRHFGIRQFLFPPPASPDDVEVIFKKMSPQAVARSTQHTAISRFHHVTQHVSTMVAQRGGGGAAEAMPIVHGEQHIDSTNSLVASPK